jgi:hypothetical protein
MSTLAAIDFEAGWNTAWNNVADAVPNIITCLVILIVGYIVAKLVENILDRVLTRVGFDGWVERGGVKRALQASNIDASDLLGRIVFYAIMLVVLATAFGVFGQNPVSTYLSAAVAYLPKVFVALVIIVIAAAIAAAARNVVGAFMGGVSFGRIAANLTYGLILAIGIFAALNQLEIAPLVVNAVLYAALAAIVGVVIVAVGGGGIQPMRERWASTLASYDSAKRELSDRLPMDGSGPQPSASGTTERPAPDPDAPVDVREPLATPIDRSTL